MSQQVNANYQALLALRGGIEHLLETASTALPAVEAEIQQVHRQISQSMNRCRQAVEEAKEALRIAHQNKKGVAEAHRRLRMAEEALELTRRLKSRFAQTEDRYRSQQQRLKNLIHTHGPSAKAFLRLKATELQNYKNVPGTTGVSVHNSEGVGNGNTIVSTSRAIHSSSNVAIEDDNNNNNVDDYPYSRQHLEILYNLMLRGREIENDTIYTTRREIDKDIIRFPDYPTVELKSNGDMFGSYNELRELLQIWGVTGKRHEIDGWEAHHLLEDKYMKKFGFSKDEGLCVAIYSTEHMSSVHGEFGTPLHLGRGNDYHIQTLVEYTVEAYDEIDRPEWNEKLYDYVKSNRERLIRAYENGTVSGATEDDIRNAKDYLQNL